MAVYGHTKAGKGRPGRTQAKQERRSLFFGHLSWSAARSHHHHAHPGQSSMLVMRGLEDCSRSVPEKTPLVPLYAVSTASAGKRRRHCKVVGGWGGGGGMGGCAEYGASRGPRFQLTQPALRPVTSLLP